MKTRQQEKVQDCCSRASHACMHNVGQCWECKTTAGGPLHREDARGLGICIVLIHSILSIRGPVDAAVGSWHVHGPKLSPLGNPLGLASIHLLESSAVRGAGGGSLQGCTAVAGVLG